LFKNVSRILGLEEQRVYYGLVMAFGLLFVLPSLGFINFAYKYNFFSDHHLTYYFLSILIFSYLGFFILRSLADRIRSISESIETSVADTRHESGLGQTSELNKIVVSFQQLMDRLENNNQALEIQAIQLRSLAEITDPNSVSMGSNLVVKLGLQKACEVIGASRGWILMLDESRRHHFTVVCEFNSNGNSQDRMGSRIPFRETQARQAVIRRKPLFLTDPIWGESSNTVEEDTIRDQGAALAVPLTTGSDVLGVLYLEGKNENSFFSSTDLDFALPLAACLSYRYENLQLRNHITIQTDQFNCISAFNEICSKGLVQGKVFQLLARELQTYMPTKVSFLALSDTSQEYLQLLEVASEEPISLRSGMTLPLRQSLFKSVLEENREVHQKDVTSVLNPLEARWFRELGINSCYLAPFRLQGVNAGILFVGSDTKEGFSNPQQVILQQAVQYLGLAVHNQMLLQKIDEQGRELEALNRIGSVVTSALFDVDKVLDEVGVLVDRMITVEAGAIYLREENGLVVRKSFGTQASRIEPFKVKNIEGICGYVMSRGESVLVRDASQNPHVSSMVKYFGGAKVRSILCVPMVVGGEVIGAIHMWNKSGGSFNAHDNQVMKSVASSLATAIASSRLHQMCQRLTTQEASACGTP
jgi:GAF domain-containing protein